MKSQFTTVFISIILITLIPFVGRAQFYAKADVGYGMPEGKQVIGTNLTITPSGSVSQEVVRGSYGSGIYGQVGAGIRFSDYVAAELDFSYLLGKKYKFTDENANFLTEQTHQGSSIMLNPKVVFSTGNTGVYGFGSAGIVLPLTSMIKMTEEASGSDTVFSFSYSKSAESELKGGFTAGCSGSAGIGYELSEQIHLYGELFYTSHTIVQKEWNLTSYTETVSTGGPPTTTELGELSQIDVQTEYVEVLTDDDNDDPDQSLKALVGYSPFGAGGIRVGVRINF